jgi:serine/threonine-protein kinase
LYQRADEKSLNEAVSLYEKALALDSTYAAAWAGLSLTYGSLADAYQAPRSVIPKAKAAALRAIALDDSLATGHLALGSINETWEWNYASGVAEYRKALRLDPNAPDIHLWYGEYLALVEQDYEGAEREMGRAAALDPFDPQTAFYQTLLATSRGEFDRALAFARRVTELTGSREYYGTNLTARVYAAMGRWQDCVAATLPDSLATDLQAHSSIGAMCAVHQGHPEVARRQIQRLEALARTRYLDGTTIATLYAALGDNDHAIQWLERAAEDRSANMRSIRSDVSITPEIRADPRYAALLVKLGLPPKGPPRDLSPR